MKYLIKEIMEEVEKTLTDKLSGYTLNTTGVTEIPDDRFCKAVSEFKITVPDDYNHDTWFATFAKKTKKLSTTCNYDSILTDANFSKASNKLVPGKTYTVKIFPILKRVSSKDCLEFLKKQKAILVGAQGLFLAHSLKKEEFPMSKWTVSFDKKNCLWKDADGYRRVPRVDRSSDGDWHFRLGYFESKWDGDYCLLCVCDN